MASFIYPIQLDNIVYTPNIKEVLYNQMFNVLWNNKHYNQLQTSFYQKEAIGSDTVCEIKEITYINIYIDYLITLRDFALTYRKNKLNEGVQDWFTPFYKEYLQCIQEFFSCKVEYLSFNLIKNITDILINDLKVENPEIPDVIQTNCVTNINIANNLSILTNFYLNANCIHFWEMEEEDFTENECGIQNYMLEFEDSGNNSNPEPLGYLFYYELEDEDIN